MSTVQTWISRTRGYLQGTQADSINRLASAYYPGDDELVLEFEMKGIVGGVPLSAGRACFLALETDVAAGRVTVMPEWEGADDVVLPEGTIIRVRPKFFDHAIFDALTSTLAELTSPDLGIFGVDQITLPYIPSRSVYDLLAADGYEAPISVTIGNPNDATDTWPALRENGYEIRQIQPTEEFPSGLQLRLFNIPSVSEADTIMLTYKKALIMPGDVDSPLDGCGLIESAYDLPPMGAAVRLAIPQEMRRNSLSAQGDSRRAEEVPAGAVLGSARALNVMYRNRVQQEYTRLLRAYPLRFR